MGSKLYAPHVWGARSMEPMYTCIKHYIVLVTLLYSNLPPLFCLTWEDLPGNEWKEWNVGQDENGSSGYFWVLWLFGLYHSLFEYQEFFC